MKKRIIAGLLTTAMVASLAFAGCGSEAGSSAASSASGETSSASVEEASSASAASEASASSSAEAPAEATSEFPEYVLGTNIWGSGSYVLESQASTAKVNFDGTGITVKPISDDFTADKLTQDCQTLISDGCNAILFSVNAQPSFLPIADICEQNNVPIVYYDKAPADEQVMQTISSKSTYVGTIVCSNADFGAQIAEQALADGHKKAIIVRAAAGDASHDEREKGFTDAFVAGGGEILGVTNCADPSEAVTKSNDLITAYGEEADCLYGLGSDFAIGAINAIASRTDDYSKNLAVYTSDFTPDMAQLILDGQLAALNGGQLEECTIAGILAANYLDGHPILDENGNAPFFDQMKPCTITKDNAQDYVDKMNAGEPIIAQDIYGQLLYRNNPDVTYDDFVEFLENYDQIYLEGISS